MLLAKARGYTFTVKDLETQLSQLPDEEVASIFNPGIEERRHLSQNKRIGESAV
ncbi:MAG: hypothetical protein AAFY63_11270 [Cyanobacteria bacterium J06643_13]